MSNEIASTILSQLGGRKFMMMTGASNMGAGKSSLSMKIPRTKGKEGSVTHVKITLNGKDLYDVEYIRIHGMKMTTVYEDNDIYCDMLRSSFETYTGLYTSMF